MMYLKETNSICPVNCIPEYSGLCFYKNSRNCEEQRNPC